MTDVVSVGEVKSSNIHASINEAGKTLNRPACGTKGANDLSAARGSRKLSANVLQTINVGNENKIVKRLESASCNETRNTHVISYLVAMVLKSLKNSWMLISFLGV